MKSTKGFTLLEILLVIGIIAILAGIVIVAINPSKQLAQVRNSQRKSDLKQVANAITQFYIDHSYYPASSTFSTTTLKTICPTGASTSPAAGFDCTNMLNLSELVPTYLTAIPRDPATTTTAGYSVMLVNKQPAVSAPLAELGVTISVGNVPGRIVESASSSQYIIVSGVITPNVAGDYYFGGLDPTNGNAPYYIRGDNAYAVWYWDSNPNYDSLHSYVLTNGGVAQYTGDALVNYDGGDIIGTYTDSGSGYYDGAVDTAWGTLYTCLDSSATDYLATSSSPFDCTY